MSAVPVDAAPEAVADTALAECVEPAPLVMTVTAAPALGKWCSYHRAQLPLY